jgi:valyl-tRNA synthetase
MSKTKGNVVDPLGVIEELGADSLRFALVNGITPGNDQRLGRAKLEGARNFGNKLWNAARFVLGARPAELDADAPLVLPAAADLGPGERWILGRTAETIDAVRRSYEELQIGEVAGLLYEAIWSEYADWYIELAKVRLRSGASEAERVATWTVLAWVLDRYLRLLHPIMPFITEEIWARLPHRAGDPGLLAVADWPSGAEERAVVPDPDAAERPVRELIDLARAVRNARVEAGIEAGAWLEGFISLGSAETAAAFAALKEGLSSLVRTHLRAVEGQEALDEVGAGLLVVISGPNEVRLARAGADLDRERARLERELADARGLLAAAEGRLANPEFVARAPAVVVEGTRRRVEELAGRVAILEDRLAAAG